MLFPWVSLLWTFQCRFMGLLGGGGGGGGSGAVEHGGSVGGG